MGRARSVRPVPDRSLAPVAPSRPIDPPRPAAPPRPANRAPDGERRRQLAVVGAGVWGAVVLVGLVVGTFWVRPRGDMSLTAAPLGGSWSPQVDGRWLPAVVLAVVVVAHGPGVAGRMRWRPLLAASALLTVAWATALAAGRGWSDIGEPLTSKFEYLAAVPQVGSPGEFLRSFTDRITEYPTHVKGHPPGLPLAFWALDRAHLQGPGWAAALVIAAAGLATAGALVTVRAVAGEGAARRCAPFMALAPGALWLATSGDALIAGVGWAGVALLVAGRRPAAQVAGGAVLGLAGLLTYGAVPLLAVPVVVAVARGDLRPLARAAGGLAAVIGLAAAAGFWWADGLAATHEQYWAGVASDRPFGLFAFVVNPAALALAAGPAVAAGLALTLGDGLAAARRAWSTRDETPYAADVRRPAGGLAVIGGDTADAAPHPADVGRPAGGVAVIGGDTADAAPHAADVGRPAGGVAVIGGDTADAAPHAADVGRPAGGLAVIGGDTARGERRAQGWGERAKRAGRATRAARVARAPAVAAALVPLGGLLAVVAADASGLSKGEVERIWLPFVPALLAATAALGHRRAWLAAQAALTLVLAVTLDSPW